jgi:DNA-binding transcriptional LysR family regulator
MTLQQLLGFCAVVDNDLRVSRAAEALHTTQPAVSKMLRAVEEAVGAEIFLRRGNRLLGLTEAGREALALARRAVHAARDMQAIGHGSGQQGRGTLRIATTHIHARYALMPVLQRFAQVHPGVDVALVQGSSAQIADWVEQGAADIGLSSLPARVPPGVAGLECYPIERCLIVPHGHPLLAGGLLTLEAIAGYPLITYDEQFDSGQVVRAGFQRKGLAPRIVLRATEADTIKAYVGAGFGVAVIQKMAVDPRRDQDLRVIDTGSLFPTSIAFLTLRRDSFLRAHLRDFIGMVEARWSGPALDAALEPQQRRR